MNNEHMSIDDRLKFLLTSTESLHASCQELHATVARQAERAEKQGEQAAKQELRLQQLHAGLLAAIRAFLEGAE